tara:strand:- start:288 stop:515 length:228 start_codon:yes stop_codon:yes gene_type:complete
MDDSTKDQVAKYILGAQGASQSWSKDVSSAAHASRNLYVKLQDQNVSIGDLGSTLRNRHVHAGFFAIKNGKKWPF